LEKMSLAGGVWQVLVFAELAAVLVQQLGALDVEVKRDEERDEVLDDVGERRVAPQVVVPTLR
jgi:hypothetical protein